MKRLVVLAMLLAAAASSASAQDNAGRGPGGGAANRQPPLPPEKTIPFAMALDAAKTAIDLCVANKEPASVVVMDMNMTLKIVLSADGATTTSVESARKKAYTAFKKGMPSADFAKSLTARPAPGEAIEGDPNLMAAGGGYPIKKGDMIIGAFGISSPAGRNSAGQSYDEYCGNAGIAKIQF
jgi:uncharacterized protein GlcG (DUF336 family)